MFTCGPSLLVPATTAPTYSIANSVRFRSSVSAYLSRTPSAASNRTTWTWSGWVKRGAFADTFLFSSNFNSGNGFTGARFFSDQLNILSWTGSTAEYNLTTSQVFRDPAAWYHLIFSVDTTQVTASNRLKIYVNGSQVTSFSSASYPTLNYGGGINNNVLHTIAANWNPAGASAIDGYLAEINFIDGQALTPSSFGQTNTAGVWVPKAYAGSYGTNGYYLKFNNGSTLTSLCLDRSGNGNNWVATNVSLTPGVTYDWMVDTPTNNYCVLNPLISTTYTPTISEASLRTTAPNASGGYIAFGTIGVTSGKWYYEATCAVNDGINIYPIVGTGDMTDQGNAPGTRASGAGYWSNGSKYVNGATTGYGTSWTAGDTIGVAFDLDSAQRTVQFFKNGVSQGVINVTTTTSVITPQVGVQGTNESMQVNFGQRPFSYSPPSGFKALSTSNT